MRTIKKTLCLVLVLSMMLGLGVFGASAKFEDAEDIEPKYTEATEVLNAIKVLEGFEDGTFRPTETLLRGQSAAIVARLLAFNGIGVASSFTDTPDWADGYIAFCEQMKIVAGYGDGTFGPNDTLTGGQFMKMLLVALGYNPIVEGLQDVGELWIINVARLGKQIGLDAGIPDFPYLDPITREQAAQLALNALKAPLVQYDFAGNIQYVTTVAADEQTISRQTLSNSQGNTFTVELGERYFKLLKLNTALTDAFETPANTWTNNGKPIGTYARTPNQTYTTMVNASTIFNDLGLSAPVPVGNISVFVDGASVLPNDDGPVPVALSPIAKTNTTNKFGGAGSVTKVFYTSATNSLTIVVINTYVSQVSSVTAATSARNASVTLSTLKTNATWPGFKDGAAAPRLTFETTDFAKGDFVAYTYSLKDGVNKIISMKLADKVEGKLERATANTSVTLDGTSYNAGREVVPFANASASIGKTLNVYLDEYGYALYTSIGAAVDPTAVVVGLQAVSSQNISKEQVRLLFTATASDAVGSIGTVNGNNAFKLDDDLKGNAPGAAGFGFFDIVTYTGTYNMNVVAESYQLSGTGSLLTKGSATPNYTYFKTYNTNDDAAANRLGFDGTTKFIIATAKNGDGRQSGYTYASYDGIANVPNVTFNANYKGGEVPYAAIYTGTDNIADIVFIMNPYDAASKTACLTVQSGSKDLVFIMGNPSGNKTFVEGDSYYVYRAIVNGELKDEYITREKVENWTLLAAPSYNAKGHMTGAVNTYEFADKVDKLSAQGFLHYATGVNKVQNGTVTFGDGTYAIASDAQVFYMDTTGAMTPVAVADLGTTADNNDEVWYRVEDNTVTHIFVNEVPSTSSAAGGALTAKLVNNGSAIDLQITNNTAANVTFTYTVMQSVDGGKTYSAVANVTTGTTAAKGLTTAVVIVENATSAQSYYVVVTFGNGDTATTNSVVGGGAVLS